MRWDPPIRCSKNKNSSSPFSSTPCFHEDPAARNDFLLNYLYECIDISLLIVRIVLVSFRAAILPPPSSRHKSKRFVDQQRRGKVAQRRREGRRVDWGGCGRGGGEGRIDSMDGSRQSQSAASLFPSHFSSRALGCSRPLEDASESITAKSQPSSLASAASCSNLCAH